MTAHLVPTQEETLTEAPVSAPGTLRKFGTFRGVFLPTLLTILGAVLYLRTGWMVGNAGLGGAVAVILLAHLITVSTGMSVASIATNIRVRAGGAFSIISQSLGLEVSGSVSVPFYIAQSIAVGFYIFAFTEGWLRIFPDHPEALVIFGVFGVMFVIASISANLASRTQLLIFGVQIIALSSVFLGSFALLNNQGFTVTPQFWGDFLTADFWAVFAVYFPAVTGILAGVNLSGSLRDPRRSIPLGMLSAVLLAMLVYLAVSVWFSGVATPEELVNNVTVMVDRALFGPAVLAGLLAATFSAGLTSLVGAPRILQALAANNVLPNGDELAKISANGEPRQAMRVTALVTLLTLIAGYLTGGLNAIAPLLTMFFLVTYAVLNAVVLVEQSLSLVSFRPRFRIPSVVPLVGLIGSLSAMFLIDPAFSLVSLVVIVGLYVYLTRRPMSNPWGDVRSGLFVSLAEWAAMRVGNMSADVERAWKPNLLVPITSREELLGSYRFIKAMLVPRGSVHLLTLYPENDPSCVDGASQLVDAFTADRVYARASFQAMREMPPHQDAPKGLHAPMTFAAHVRMGIDTLQSVFFRPNALFLSIDGFNDDEAMLNELLAHCRQTQMGALVYAPHPVANLGREQTINVWIREQNLDWEHGQRLERLNLSLLLAIKIATYWHGSINLITVLNDEDHRHHAETFMANLRSIGRMPRNTRAIVAVGDFHSYLRDDAPLADLNIFGLAPRLSVSHVNETVSTTRAACLFVQDSGRESVLA